MFAILRQVGQRLEVYLVQPFMGKATELQKPSSCMLLLFMPVNCVAIIITCFGSSQGKYVKGRLKIG